MPRAWESRPGPGIVGQRLQPFARYSLKVWLMVSPTPPITDSESPSAAPEAAGPFRALFNAIRNRIISGLVLALPIVLTFWIVYWLYTTLTKGILDPLAQAIGPLFKS